MTNIQIILALWALSIVFTVGRLVMLLFKLKKKLKGNREVEYFLSILKSSPGIKVLKDIKMWLYNPLMIAYFLAWLAITGPLVAIMYPFNQIKRLFRKKKKPTANAETEPELEIPKTKNQVERETEIQAKFDELKQTHGDNLLMWLNTNIDELEVKSNAQHQIISDAHSVLYKEEEEKTLLENVRHKLDPDKYEKPFDFTLNIESMEDRQARADAEHAVKVNAKIVELTKEHRTSTLQGTKAAMLTWLDAHIDHFSNEIPVKEKELEELNEKSYTDDIALCDLKEELSLLRSVRTKLENEFYN